MREKRFAGFTISPGEIGYAVGTGNEPGDMSIIKYGVVSFPDGIVHDNSGEHSACADRRMNRQVRRGYARKRLRKIETLRVLSRYGLCPRVTEEELKEWRYGKVYPASGELREWLATDIENNVNPYHDRYVCATQVLDLSKESDRFCLGRAIYHLCQRRGYLSNAREENRNNAAGQVNTGISELSKAIEESGVPTLGAYFYHRLLTGEGVRRCYTGREVHYAAEFNYICDRQQIPDDMRHALHRAVFFHRPLKSQKGSVGRCVFEPSKFRCQRSHPLFEEYRMWSLVNNIKVRRPGEIEPERLTAEEVDRVAPLFYRSKEYFKFEDIARAVAGKGMTYGHAGDHRDCDFEFNYAMDTSVTGNATIHQLIAALGKDSGASWKTWKEVLAQRYRLAKGKSVDDIISDVWHVFMFFDTPEKVREWFRENLGVADQRDLDRLASYAADEEYSSLSICAVRKILPFLEQGYRYDEAVFFANLWNVLPEGASQSLYDVAFDGMASIMNDFEVADRRDTKEEAVEDFLRNLCPDVRVGKLYHPSAVGNPSSARVVDGAVVLGEVDFSMRNPVAHRAETQLRKLVNELSARGYIDRDTRIRVAVSTEMHGMNQRKGISMYQADREAARRAAREGIEAFFAERGEKVVVSEEQITKWLLWEEQQHTCLYTGETISASDFLGPAARFDIEHTVPLSRGGDDSLMNKTLCASIFNRKIKGAKLPCELNSDVYEEILSRIDGLGWTTELERMQSEFSKLRERARKSVEGKDDLLRKAARLKYHLDYLKGKLYRMRMRTVPAGFAFRQDAIGKTVRNHIVRYLKSGYRYVFSESEEVVRAYRSLWGLPSRYEYDRSCHRKNCIDAMVVACLSRSMHDEWKRYWEIHDGYSWARKPQMATPWATFTKDVLEAQASLPVYLESRDNFVRNRRHVVRNSRGRIVRGADGRPLYQDSDCIGVSLHKASYFSCRKDTSGNLAYGKRVMLAGISGVQARKIVDPALREAVLETLSAGGGEAMKDFVFHGRKVRHVRIDAQARNYIPVFRHRDVSDKEHRRFAYVDNDTNYCIGLYDGGEAEIVSPYKAVMCRRNGEDMVPRTLNGQNLRALMKANTMVLFYENDKEELLKASRDELLRRLYVLSRFCMSNGSKYLFFKHVAEKRPTSQCDCRMGRWKEEDEYRPVMSCRAQHCRILIEGVDFTVNRLGELMWL